MHWAVCLSIRMVKVVIWLLVGVAGASVCVRQIMDLRVVLNTTKRMLEVVIWLMMGVAGASVGIREIVDLRVVFDTSIHSISITWDRN